jgi:Family of unknown function (DUF6510)
MNSLAGDYLDGNAAAGELATIFCMDITVAEGQCASCGATKRFADARVYMGGPGLVARCSRCENVLLRFVQVEKRVLLDARGMTYIVFAEPEGNDR